MLAENRVADNRGFTELFFWYTEFSSETKAFKKNKCITWFYLKYPPIVSANAPMLADNRGFAEIPLEIPFSFSHTVFSNNTKTTENNEGSLLNAEP